MESARPRMLIVSAVPPEPQSVSGFAARLRHFLDGAAEHVDVTLVLVRQPFRQDIPELGPDLNARVRIVDARSPAWNEHGLKGKLTRTFFQYPLDPLPRSCVPRRVSGLRQIFREDSPDLVAFHLPYLAHLARDVPDGVPLIAILEERWECVVADSLEGSRWKQRLLFEREMRRFQSLYRRVGKMATAVVAISPEEKDAFSANIDPDKITVIPHAVDTDYFRTRDWPAPLFDVLVVGDLRAPRNYVGALRTWEEATSADAPKAWRWGFVGQVDPEVAARLRGAGATVTGPVEDVRPYYERARVVIVPAFSGGGVKTTSIQAWAMGRPLIASPVGAQGLPAEAGRNMLIANDAAGLVAEITRVLNEPGLARDLAVAGRHTAELHCSASGQRAAFGDLCIRILRRQPATHDDALTRRD